DAAFAESTTQSSTTRLEIASTEASSADSKMQELKDEKEDTEKFFASLTEKLTQLSNIKDGLSYKLESRLQQKQKADETAQGVSRTLENATQRLGVLKDLERSMEGYQNSVKSVIKAADNHRLRGIIGTVASILSVTSGYEMAIETALGFAMQNVVVQDETAAKAAMAMLKQDNAGRATFLPLDTVKGSTLDAKLSGSAKGAASLVQYDAKYQNIVTNMLGRIVIVDDINEASYNAKQNNFRVKIVTRDGQVINAGGSFTGGSVARSAGVFSRKQEIDELKAKIITLGEEQKTAAEQCTKIKAETDKLSAEVSATESEIITINGDKIRCEVELSRITQNYEQHIANTNALKAECEQLKTAIAEFGEKRKTALCESDKLASDIEKLEKELMGIDGNDD
ncbi:MAG: chromosome segregation protein SMC, partial [Oscillospiraceae bacterium]